MNRRNFFKTIIALSGYFTANFIFSKNKKIKAESFVFKGKAPKSLWKYSKEVYHYIKSDKYIQCTTCPNKCILSPGDRGICRDKVYINNKLYNIAYGNPSAIDIDPIEKKPLYHFYPGTNAFSIATGGCPLRCLNCQNWQLSQSSPEELRIMELFPNDVVKKAKKSNSKSIAYTYSEPVAWYEYMYDTAKIAKNEGVKNVWVTSGYIEEKPLLKLIEVLDAANVDVKSFSDDIYKNLNAGKLKPILNTLKILDKYKVWFEITCLIVPTYSDSMDMIKNMCKWILDNIGSGYPIHFSRFHSAHNLTHLPPTPISTLERAYNIAKDQGIKHVYIGNVPGTKASNTICPKCKKILIERAGYYILNNNIQNGKCKFCQTKIEGRW
jgi:pyruvate formate lyase activating enzyme